MIGLLAMGRGKLALAALTGIAAELCALGLTATAAWLISTAAGAPPLAALSVAIVAVRAFATFRGPLRYVERLAGHDAALGVLAELRGRVFDALARRRAGRTGEAGRLLSHIVADVDSVQDLLLRSLLPGVISVVAGVSATVLFLVLLPPAGLVLAVSLVLAGVVIPVAAVGAVRRLGAGVADARADLSVRTLDLVDGGHDLAAFGMRATAEERARAAAVRLARLERRSGLVSGATSAAGVLVQGAVVIAVAAIALPSGTVVTAVLALTALMAVETVLPLSGAAQTFMELLPAWRRVRDLLRHDDAPPKGGEPAVTPGALTLRDVRVSYNGTTALDGVDLKLEAGDSLAVVGASGAGKSTLLAVLSGEVTPDSGLESGTVGVPGPVRGLYQDAHVFAAPVRANLLLARPDAGDDDLRDALSRAGLPELELDTVVGEGGRGLSGGQRQRLLLARALLADPAVLLLDEPGEGLHHQLADELLARVFAARRGRTTVVVTHRLAALDGVNESATPAHGGPGSLDVIVLDRGRIVQQGPPGALREEAGPYADLWAAELLHRG